MKAGFAAWASMRDMASAAQRFVSGQYSRSKSLFFSKPEHEHELPASNIAEDEKLAAFEREKKCREEDAQRDDS